VTWYAIGAAIIAFMLAVNGAVFLLTRAAPGRMAPTIRRRLPIDELSMYAAMVTVWVVAFALPYVWPDSQWGRALAQPWALPCFVAWSMFVGVVLLAITRVARARRSAEKP
jgi:hypothetical protein